jgi:ABC-type spermidine/putrescine transport system permease subunit I
VALPDALRPATLVGIRGEELDGAAAGDRRTVPVAADFLPDPVPDRPQDLLRGILAARPAALRTGVPLARGGALQIKLLVGSYVYLFNEPLYVSAWLYSLKVAFFSTVFCLMLGYPMAYAIARSPPTQRNVLLLLIILPFWTSFLLRVYAWIGLLKTDGLINLVLFKWFGIVDEPLAMMNTSFAVYIGIVYSYLPFMILPLYSNLEKHDNTLLEARRTSAQARSSLSCA